MQVNKLNPFGNEVWNSDIQCCFWVWISLNWSCILYVPKITRNRELSSHMQLYLQLYSITLLIFKQLMIFAY